MTYRFRTLIKEGKRRFSRLLAGRYWWAPLVLLTGAIQTAATVRALLRPHPLALDVDAAFFQHGGWYILQGATLYRHIWVPTPPLSFYLATALAFVSQGDMLVLHILSVLFTGFIAVSIVLLIASLVSELTGDRLAGTIGGLVMYSFVGFYILPTLGFGYKHLALFLGLAGIWLALKRRTYLAGMAGAAAVATWSLNIVFPVLILGIVWKRSGRRFVAQMFAGALTATVLIVIPLVFSDVLEPAFQQLVIVPLQVSEEQSLAVRLKKGVRFLGLSGLFAVAAVIWTIKGLMNRQWQYWWVYLGGAYFAGLVLFLDFDSYPDLFPGMAFAAIAVGSFFAATSLRWRRYLSLFLVAAILVAPVIRIQLRRTDSASSSPAQPAASGDVRLPSMQEMYWEKIKPDTCHYRLSGTERQWIERMKQRGRPVECSALE